MKRLKLHRISLLAVIDPKDRTMELIFITGGAGQGKSTYAKTHYKDIELIADYEEQVRRELEEGRDPLSEAEKLLEGADRLVITMSEVGAGLVPISAEERRFRDAAGVTGCYLAEQAAEVYRMAAGIETKLKG